MDHIVRQRPLQFDQPFEIHHTRDGDLGTAKIRGALPDMGVTIATLTVSRVLWRVEFRLPGNGRPDDKTENSFVVVNGVVAVYWVRYSTVELGEAQHLFGDPGPPRFAVR